MAFRDFVLEAEEEEMNMEQDELKAKIIALFDEGPLTTDNVAEKAAELELDPIELQNKIFTIFYDLVMSDEGEEETEEADAEVEAADAEVEYEDSSEV